MEPAMTLRWKLLLACAPLALLLCFLPPAWSGPPAVVDGDPGTIGACLTQPDGTRVTLPREEVIWRGKSGKSFGIKEWFEKRTAQTRLVVVSTRSLPVGELWTVDVTGVFGTLSDSSDGSDRQRVLIVSPDDVLVYCDPKGRPFFFPSLKGSRTDWPNKRSLADMVGVGTAGLSSLEEGGFPPMPDSPLSGAPTYCATIAEAKSQPDGTAVELQCKPINSATAGSFVMGEDGTSDTLTTYYTHPVTPGDRVNKVTGTIQSSGGDKVVDIDSGPGFDPEGFVGSAQIAAQGTIPWAKTLPDYGWISSPATIDAKVVSRIFPAEGYFYIQEQNRCSGIRVYDSGLTPEPGDVVSILDGYVFTEDGERAIYSCWTQTDTPVDPPAPLGLGTRALGGGDFNVFTKGPTGGYGTNNVGLLVRTWGKVTGTQTNRFYLDDGAGVGGEGYPWGICVEGCPGFDLASGDDVAVTGVSRLLPEDEVYHPLLRLSGPDNVSALAGVPPSGLAAASTGSGKITLFWKGVDYANGYNVYRALSSSGPWTKVNASPVTTRDPGPVPNGFMHSDTGLTNGTEYYYYVTAVSGDASESRPSNQDSAVPDADSVPWDTCDPAQIITAWRNLLTEPGDPPLGLLTVLAPNGVVYQSYSDQAPDAAPPTAYFDGNQGMLLEGEVATPVTMDFADDETLGDGGEGVEALTGYDQTQPGSGIFRKVEAVTGYRSLKSKVILPPTDRDHALFGPGYNPGHAVYRDAAYIYTGGGSKSAGWEVDAGLQLGTTGNPGWKPYIIAKSKEVRYPAIAGVYWIYTDEPLRIDFRVPGFKRTPDKQVALTMRMNRPRIHHQYRYRDTGEIRTEWLSECTFTCPVPGWRKTTTDIRIKRVNSIAQNQNVLGDAGYHPTGSYVYGAAWGSWDDDAVKLLTSDYSSNWTYGLTYKQGRYPRSGPTISYNVQNIYFWETDIVLRTNPQIIEESGAAPQARLWWCALAEQCV